MLAASVLVCRTACWADGLVNEPGSVRSGTAAQSPAPQASSTPSTLRSAVQRSRPFSSSGRSVRASIGLALTPAVHTIVSASNSSPSVSTTCPPVSESTLVLSRTSMFRLSSCFTVYSAIGTLTSGRIRPVASMSTQRMSSGSTLS
jgi:hypothetical protein